MRIDYRLCATSMVAAIIALLYAGIGGHFAPSPLPTDSVESVAAFYRQFGHRILTFAWFNCMAAALIVPAFCALAAAMVRMDRRNLTLAIVQISGGVLASVGPFLGGMFLAAAVIRANGSPHVMAAFTDLAVLFIELSTLPALFQAASIALAVARNRSPRPLLPKWYGWLTLAWGIMAQGGLLAVFHETGPLSSTGFVGIVLPMVGLLTWMAATAFVLFRIRAEGNEGASDAPYSLAVQSS